jgi:hypothetical protein
MDDAMALASGATTAEADAAAAAAVPHYSWQDTATARAFIEANKKLEERKARILAGEVLDDAADANGASAAISQQQRRQTPSQQQQSQLPTSASLAASNSSTTQQSNRMPDSLDKFHAEATIGSNGHVSRFNQTQQQQQQQFSHNGFQLTQFGGGDSFGMSNGASTARSTRRRNAGEPVAVLAGVPVTARQFQRPNETAASRTLAAQGALTARSRAPVRSTGGANFQLRGAGALPTHRATTHGTLMRLAAGATQSPNGRSGRIVVQDPLAHQSNWDLSSWGADVQRNLAGAKGTLATQRPRPAGTR